MTDAQASEARERREMRKSLRWVSRLLRGFAIVLILIGTAGLLLGSEDDWSAGPSWFSLIVGAVLFFASVVQRVRSDRRSRKAGLPQG
ncbi:hypothetical protein [Tsuneonella sp. HG222]